MAKDDTQFIQDLLRDIESAKTKKSEATGELNVLMKRLKDDHGVKNEKEGEEKLAALRKKIVTLNDEIAEEIAGIRETYDA